MKRRYAIYPVILVLSLLALVSIGRSIHYNFLTPAGGIDFHSYWYAGIFVRQKADPYAAYLLQQEPKTPVSFLNGHIATELPRGGALATTPANTAPLLLLLAPFSWLSWPTARSMWFAINLGLALIMPWLVLRLLLPPLRLSWVVLVSTCLIFYALKGTRAALGGGQTTLLAFTLMILSLATWQNSWLVSGLLLGVALSKYSIALPVLIFFIYKREFKVVAVGILVQLIGILIISSSSGSTPYSIIQSYYQIMLAHIDLPGIHLAELFSRESQMRVQAPILLTIVTCGILAWLFLRERHLVLTSAWQRFRDLHLLTLLSLWTLLVAYHRAHDGILAVLFISMIVYGLIQPGSWKLSRRQHLALVFFSVFTAAMLITPYEQIGSLLPWDFTNDLLDLISKGVILTLVAMLGITMWLTHRVYCASQPASFRPFDSL